MMATLPMLIDIYIGSPCSGIGISMGLERTCKKFKLVSYNRDILSPMVPETNTMATLPSVTNTISVSGSHTLI
jgi:hypothetical protein